MLFIWSDKHVGEHVTLMWFYLHSHNIIVCFHEFAINWFFMLILLRVFLVWCWKRNVLKCHERTNDFISLVYQTFACSILCCQSSVFYGGWKMQIPWSSKNNACHDDIFRLCQQLRHFNQNEPIILYFLLSSKMFNFDEKQIFLLLWFFLFKGIIFFNIWWNSNELACSFK